MLIASVCENYKALHPLEVFAMPIHLVYWLQQGSVDLGRIIEARAKRQQDQHRQDAGATPGMRTRPDGLLEMNVTGMGQLMDAIGRIR